MQAGHCVQVMPVGDRVERGHTLKSSGAILNQHSDAVSKGKDSLLKEIYHQGE